MGIARKLNLQGPGRPPTPPRYTRKAVVDQPVDQPPQKLLSILRPPKPYLDALSDGTLLDSPNGSTDGKRNRKSDGTALDTPNGSPDGSPKRSRKSVSFSDVPELVPPLKVKSTMLPRPLLKRVDRSANARRTMIEIQNEVIAIRRRYNHYRSRFARAAQDMLDATLQLVALVDGMPIDANVKSIVNESWIKFKLQGSELIAQDRYLKESDRSLENMEETSLTINSNLLERELKLFESYDQFDVPERHHLVENLADDDDGTVSARSASSWENPTIKEYYDKIGEVSLAMDHLHNLDTEHLSKLYSWESARQRGIQVTAKQLDNIFADYFRERRGFLTHYMRCRHETNIFYQLCKDQNLDVEPPNLPPEDFTTLDSSLRRTAWDMRGIDATSMEGGGSEEQLRHRGSEPSRRAPINSAQLSKEKVWSWLGQMPGHSNPRKANNDAIALRHREPESRFISGIVDSVGVQSQKAPETVANQDPDLIPELDRFPFDKFQGGIQSRRRDSDPGITDDLVARLKLRDEHKRFPRPSSVAAEETSAERDHGEADQFAVMEGFQMEIAVRNVALFYLDPSDVPALPPPPPRPVRQPGPPPEIPPPPVIPRPRVELPDDVFDVPPQQPPATPPPVPPPPPEGFPQGPPVLPEHPPGLPPPPEGFQNGPPVLPEHPPGMPPPGSPEEPPASHPAHPPIMPPPPHPHSGHPNGPPQGPVIMPPYPPPPPPRGFPGGPPQGRRFGPPPPPPPPPRWRDGPPTMPQGTPGPPPPLMPPPAQSFAEFPPLGPPGPRPVTPPKQSSADPHLPRPFHLQSTFNARLSHHRHLVLRPMYHRKQPSLYLDLRLVPRILLMTIKPSPETHELNQQLSSMDS